MGVCRANSHPEKNLFYLLPDNEVLDSKHLQIIKIQQNLKVALQILGQTFYKNTKRTSLYSQSLLIHKTPAFENHLTTREIRDLLPPSLFLHEQLTHLHTGNTQTKLQTKRPMKI